MLGLLSLFGVSLSLYKILQRAEILECQLGNTSGEDELPLQVSKTSTCFKCLLLCWVVVLLHATN